ncbi:MAG TPA: cytochrome c [Terriglobales bacterium]|nr:cytochrome c [Terriglobales bacterium]
MARRGKALGKILAYNLLALVVLAALAITFTVGWTPVFGPKARPVSNRRFEATPSRLERGKYLAETRMGCIECHTPKQANVEPSVFTGKPGSGGVFLDEDNLRVVAANITPDRETGIGAWSDDEISRAIREGISKDGHALFPIMPYEEFRRMSDEELASVIVYIRTLEPVRSSLPPDKIPFPLSRLINAAPQPVDHPVSEPDMNDPIKRGEYIANISCIGCHTPAKSGKPLPGMQFAGGQPFTTSVASANITPDQSGIAYYDEKLFMDVMRTGRVKARQLHVMPWWIFAKMTDDDLKATYAYLRTVQPVKHRVDNTEPVTECKLCRHKHGAGDQNVAEATPRRLNTSPNRIAQLMRRAGLLH